MDDGYLMAQTVTAAQVRAVVDRALRRESGSQLVLVHGAPASEIDSDTLDDVAASIHGTASPLHIRRLAREAGAGAKPVVVITDISQNELGEDLMARTAGRRIWTPDRWEAVKSLFGARTIARDLADKRHLADALIEGRPAAGYPPMRGTTLDMQAALGALLKAQLGLSDAVTTLDRFLAWIDATSGSAKRILTASRDVNTDDSTDFDNHLALRFGNGVLPVLAILRADGADHLMPLLLAADVIHHDSEPDGRGTYELELETQRVELEPEWWRAAGQAAVKAASPMVLEDTRKRLDWSTAAFDRLDRYKVPHLAEHSAAIEAGFEQRLAKLGHLLTEAYNDEEPETAGSLELALAHARQHWFADPVRVDRAEMAWRLIRRGTDALSWGSRLADAANAYRSDGAWVDRARNAIARDDSVAELAAVYAQIGEAFATSRHEDNRTFAAIAQSCAMPLPDDVLGVEDIVPKVVAPLAKNAHVLLLVFDGMGYESFTEVYDLLDRSGFNQYVDEEGVAAKRCFAALPTVTRVSRTTLFAGKLRTGDNGSEERAFEANPQLVVKSTDVPAVVHHKAALRAGGIDSVPADILTSIRNDHQRVVAVVLNNIDERLKDVAGPVASWGFDELHPLRWLLDEARSNDRVVVVTSDHGHVLDRGAEQRTVTGAKERWRTTEIEPADDEVLVEGPRVVTDDQQAILPFKEQLFYSIHRNGYHGGICPQEVLVPLAVFASREDLLPNWSLDALSTPAWWIGPERNEEAAKAETPAPSRKGQQPKGTDDATPTLFDAEPTPAPQSSSADWLEQVVEALEQYRRPQIRLTNEDLIGLLTVLERHGDQPLAVDRLAALTSLPRNRIERYVSQLQALVNIDGYSVVSVIGSEVHFSRHVLDTQLELS